MQSSFCKNCAFFKFVDDVLKILNIEEVIFHEGTRSAQGGLEPIKYEDNSTIAFFQNDRKMIFLYNKKDCVVSMNKIDFPYNELVYKIK